MMREILFRGKRLDNDEWMEGYYLHLGPVANERAYMIPSYASALYTYEVDPATVCQFTGLLDKNGKRIFEGDVVRFGPHEYVIKYIEKYSRFAGTENSIVFAGFPIGNSMLIGNIYDNPELL